MRKTSFALLRTFVLAALVPALSLSLVSCDPENTAGGGTVAPEVSVPNGYVNYFIEDLSFGRSAGEANVAFQINVDWTLESLGGDGWCSVTPASGGAGLHRVTVSVTDNDTYEPRSARIHLMCGGSKVAEIRVSQDCENAVLLGRKDYSVPCTASSIEVEVRANVDFDYEVPDAGWVRERTASRALTSHTLVFDVDENLSRNSREAHILFYNSEYAVADTLTLVQEGNPEASFVDAVDLGLSVKWASCNVGAESPEGYGGYYAWGETEEKSNYSWSTYKWCNGSYDTMTKYCTNSSYGTVDNKTVLDPADDVAHVSWGGNWRIPTLDEIKELIDDCTWQWTSVNGVNGQKVTGPNGNSIFLPAAGYRYGTELYDRGSYGNYWSGTLLENLSYYAYDLYFNSGCRNWDINYRSNGFSVRPVTE